jgi:hypothetical protein
VTISFTDIALINLPYIFYFMILLHYFKNKATTYPPLSMLLVKIRTNDLKYVKRKR